MRYFDITVTPPGASKPFRQWTTHPGGVYDPAYPSVALDLITSAYDTPVGASSVTIQGVSLQDLTQAQQFGPSFDASGNPIPGMQILIKGGMAAGLPLANPKQAGALLSGTIFQSFGNWQGTDMTLDFVVRASAYTYASPGPFVLNWKKGTPLSVALANTFDLAYGGLKQSIQISPNLIPGNDENGFYHSLEQFAQNLMGRTRGMLGPSYPGVWVTIKPGVVVASDGTVPQTPKQIVFTDLVGQPVWLGPLQLQVKTVMRGDINALDTIKMPQGLQSEPGIVQTQAASLPSFYKYLSTFKGQFIVTQIRHIGASRSPNGAEWVSILNCTALSL